MEAKKNKKVDVSSYRLMLFLLGMCISLGGVYALMKYEKEKVNVNTQNLAKHEEVIAEVENTEFEQEIPLEPPPQQEEELVEILKEVDDEVVIPKVEFKALEFDEDEMNKGNLFKDDGPGEDNETYEWYSVSEKAEFPGGDLEREKFIQQNISIPDLAINESDGGTVFVSFIVEKDGSIKNVKVVEGGRKLGYGLEEAAVEVVKKFPKWSPAKQGDKPVRMNFQVPIRIKIDN
ncbi:MAG: energy transducer TonB [Flavobacteriales bacterium]|nr:energy transducer TonB [Flavobacteriales bacterium]